MSNCTDHLLQSFIRARKGTKIIDTTDDIHGYLKLEKKDKKEIDNLLEALKDGSLKQEDKKERDLAKTAFVSSLHSL